MSLKLWTFSKPMQMHSVQEDGTFEGVLATYGAVANNDVFMHGSFNRTVEHWNHSGERVPFLWSHQPDQVLGSFVPSIAGDQLRMQGQFDLDTQLGREKHSLAKKGHARGVSIGFMDVPSKTEMEHSNEYGMLRKMGEIKLYEGSLLVFPAEQTAKITSIHGDVPEPTAEMTKEEWISAKIKKIIDDAKAEGKDVSPDQAVAMANSMYEDMMKGHAAKIFVVKTLDISVPQTITDCINHLNKLIPADPKADASTQQQTENNSAPGEGIATAVKDAIEMHDALARMWRENARLESTRNRGGGASGTSK